MSVKKIFLMFMLFLLPLQYTWAMVANYDTHNAKDAQAHFGHHEHPSSENHHDKTNLAEDTEGDANQQTADCHLHCGFMHLSCLELSNHAIPTFAPESKQFSIQHLLSYLSPPTYQPERPNWFAAV